LHVAILYLRKIKMEKSNKPIKVIKVILKFRKQADGRFVAYVKKVESKWKGVSYDEDGKKKIVIAGRQLLSNIKEFTPYKCTLMPMRSGTGFVASEATTVRYDAEITVEEDFVSVKIGNQALVYKPGDSGMYSRKNVIHMIQNHHQVYDLEGVLAEFVEKANELEAKLNYNRYDRAVEENIAS
jgi:hypothetical protein